MEIDIKNIKRKLQEIISKLKKEPHIKSKHLEVKLQNIYEIEHGCELFLYEVLTTHILPSQYISPLEFEDSDPQVNKLINQINIKINQLDVKFLNCTTYKDIQQFLNFINTIKRNLNKLKYYILNSIYIETQSGGGSIDDVEINLDEIIVINKNIVDKLENIALILEQLSKKSMIESNFFDCVSLSTKMNRDIENFLHYKSLHKTISDMIKDPAHASILSEVINEDWFIEINQIINGRPWQPIDLSDDNINNWKSDKCKDILNMSNEYSSFLKLVPNLVNLYEDMKGAVRILVRFNNITNEPIILDNYVKIDYINKTLLTTLNKINVRGIYSIYDNLNNQQMYLSPPNNQEPLKGVFDQLKDGYSNFIFGYGYSGSGKTYTLYGKDQDIGIIQYGLNDLLNENYKVELIYAFDIYGIMKYNTIHGLTVESSIIKYISTEDEFNNSINNNIYLNNQTINPTLIDKTNLYKVFSDLNEFRKTNKCIKETINNTESSRGHLFLTFEISKNDKKSYLTVIDTAGIEDPITIIGFYFEKLSHNNGNSISNILASIGNDDIKGKGKPLQWKPRKRTKKGKNLEYTDEEKRNVYQIIREGFFINETIHHLKAFLLEKQGVVYNGILQNGHSMIRNKLMFLPDKYSKENIFFRPNTASSKSILINDVLKYLSLMTKTKKQSKFIMMSVIRTDRVDPQTNNIKFLDETLNYVNSLLNN